MDIIPKSITGLAPFVMITFVIAVVIFTQQYGWVNWHRWLNSNSEEK